MVTLALIALAAGASAAALLALRRRRSHSKPAVTPLPAGIQHLAATLSDLSDVSIHLRAGRSGAGKPRLGSLLGLR